MDLQLTVLESLTRSATAYYGAGAHSGDYPKECYIPLLEDLASKGSAVAVRYMKAIKHFKNALDIIISMMYETGNEYWVKRVLDSDIAQNEFVSELAECYKCNEDLIQWTEHQYKLCNTLIEKAVARFARKNEVSETDKAVKICRTSLMIVPELKKNVIFLNRCIRTYPDEVYFQYSKTELLERCCVPSEAVEACKKGLKVFPGNPVLLFREAKSTKLVESCTEDQKLNCWNAYLEKAERGDVCFPEACYELGAEYVGKIRRLIKEGVYSFEDLLNLADNALKRGLEEERHLLPCQNTMSKNAIEVKDYLMSYLRKLRAKSWAPRILKFDTEQTFPVAPLALEDRETKLMDPKRVSLIIDHRTFYEQYAAVLQNPVVFLNIEGKRSEGKKPLELPGVKPTHESLQPILFMEMYQTSDKIYKGHCIELKSIEPVSMNSEGYRVMIVEDGNGDALKCLVLNYQAHGDTEAELGVGCCFTVLEPHIQIEECKTQAYLKVDFGKMVLHPEKRMTKLCSYCGENEAEMLCTGCKKSRYCNKNCQKNDWKYLHHRKLCAIQIRVPDDGRTRLALDIAFGTDFFRSLQD